MSDSLSEPYALVRGTLEEGLGQLGVRSAVNLGPHPVSVSRIVQFCALIEDANPIYWNESFCIERWGRLVAPPAMIQVWTLPLPWSPKGPARPQFMMMDLRMPGTSIVNVSTDIVYHRPVYVGENIDYWDEATDISDRKETRLGIGHFVTTVGHFQGSSGEEVATGTNVQFRFEPKERV